jgi:tripeptidyl-peptidase-1
MDNHACRAHNGNDCIEANLDVQYLMAVAQHVPTTYYYWSGEDFLLEWIQQVAEMTNPPLVFSISYGVDEPELPASYGQQFDIQAMKLGVRGVTILASSGDDGAVSPSAASNSMNCGYNPSFPATSPYVTAVGGTMVSASMEY